MISRLQTPSCLPRCTTARYLGAAVQRALPWFSAVVLLHALTHVLVGGVWQRELTLANVSLAQWQSGQPDTDALIETAIARQAEIFEEKSGKVLMILRAKDEQLAKSADELANVTSELEQSRITTAALAAQLETMATEGREREENMEELYGAAWIVLCMACEGNTSTCGLTRWLRPRSPGGPNCRT